jgi:dTDP-4-dehydrorhamnose reductase
VKILVLGATGMLGNVVLEYLSGVDGFVVAGTSTSTSEKFLNFNVLTTSLDDVIGEFKPDWVINCIGKIKPEINEGDSASVSNAIKVNALFPFELASAEGNFNVIQIATDCVFSGKTGSYAETDEHDATDVYGKTKSLGECNGGRTLNIRCSIIGTEINKSKSLIGWVLNQPKGSKINGFLNHRWNGVTTLAFARITAGIIQNSMLHKRDLTIHLVPKNVVDKFTLVGLIADRFDRGDLTVLPMNADNPIDRTLSTNFSELNLDFWLNGGYVTIPTIEEMLNEYVDWISQIQYMPFYTTRDISEPNPSNK